MRRQARLEIGGTRSALRCATALQVWLWLLIFVFQNEFRIATSIQPGYLDFDNLPETNFTCTGKVIGGYYADLETSCQMFHVCTVGQQEEPMDIKFLCLNGTVFDQETRVCERVDEVDCTKSEKFYSLNLELYGSTVPPIIQPEEKEPVHHDVTTVKSNNPSINPVKAKPQDEVYPTINDVPDLEEGTLQTHTDSHDPTDDTPQETSQHSADDHDHVSNNEQHTENIEPLEEDGEDEEEDQEDEDIDYDNYTPVPSTSSPTTTTQTTTTKAPTTTQPPTTHAPSTTAHDPALLSPQEFIYRHRGPGAEAISFQRQSFPRPADGVYITHAPPNQFDHFQYESSRTAPRPSLRPVPFSPRAPMPFRATTHDPRDQLLRPGPASQPSERHETAIRHRHTYPSSLPLAPARPSNSYHFDRKRSDESAVVTAESPPVARSVSATYPAEKPSTKTVIKSPPRVIVTASASVSDSNGKKLNYTVGNVVRAVKPIVPINYDDFKESDLLFDPFFLDVPKLQKRRKTRASDKRVVTVPAKTFASTAATAPAVWSPDDYVDDNYEPHVFLPPVPQLAVLTSLDRTKATLDRKSINSNVEKKVNLVVQKPTIRRTHIARPTVARAKEVTSSQNVAKDSMPRARPRPAPPPAARRAASAASLAAAPTECAQSRFNNCRTRT